METVLIILSVIITLVVLITPATLTQNQKLTLENERLNSYWLDGCDVDEINYNK